MKYKEKLSEEKPREKILYLNKNNRKSIKMLNTKKANTIIDNKIKKYGNFEKQLDKMINKSLPTGQELYLGYTPKILQKLGLKNLQITISQSKIKKILARGQENSHYHNIPLNTIKKIPKAIKEPLLILKSSTQKNSIVIITNLHDRLERPILISINTCKKRKINNIEFLSNEITSSYGKKDCIDYVKREIEKGNLIYFNNKIKKEPLHTRVQFPEGVSSSKNNISHSNNNVNTSIKY